MFSFNVILLVVSCAGLLTDARSLKARHPSETPESFNIYAYGDSISGLPVFYADGKAQLGSPKYSTAKVAESVYFTTSSSAKTWVAHTGSDETILSLPSSSGSVEFVSSSGFTATPATGFSVYGNYVMTDVTDLNFFAVPTDAKGVYSLVWSSGGDGCIPVILRTIAPATEANL
ncbi:hypothetical protein BJX99DRAFT_254099 [Aspergillus californicus]